MRKGRHSTEAAKETWKTALTGFPGPDWPGRASRVSLSHLDVSVSEHSQVSAGPQPWRLGSLSAPHTGGSSLQQTRTQARDGGRPGLEAQPSYLLCDHGSGSIPPL